MIKENRSHCSPLSDDCQECVDYEFCLKRREATIIRDVHTCFHCGNTGVLKFIGTTGRKPDEPAYDNMGNKLSGDSIDHEKWFIFECPVCRRPVVLYEYTCDMDSLSLSDSAIETKYPSVPILSGNIPLGIYNSYMAAVKTKGINYEVCLQSLRSVLERICKDKGESEGLLNVKIEKLIKNKILPAMFADACWIIRKLGNEAAHGDNIEHYEYEVEQVITYISEIINYLYCLPAMTSNMRQRMELEEKERKQRQSKNNA